MEDEQLVEALRDAVFGTNTDDGALRRLTDVEDAVWGSAATRKRQGSPGMLYRLENIETMLQNIVAFGKIAMAVGSAIGVGGVVAFIRLVSG